jgi:hypothetical protein
VVAARSRRLANAAEPVDTCRREAHTLFIPMSRRAADRESMMTNCPEYLAKSIEVDLACLLVVAPGVTSQTIRSE